MLSKTQKFFLVPGEKWGSKVFYIYEKTKTGANSTEGKNMAKLISFVRLLVRLIAVMEKRFYLGSAAVGAAFVAAALTVFGVSEDTAVTLAASAVGALSAILGRYITSSTENRGEVKLVKVSKDLDIYLQKLAGKKVNGNVVWYAKDPPISFKRAKEEGYDLGCDEEGNIYNIISGMIIGEIIRDKKHRNV